MMMFRRRSIGALKLSSVSSYVECCQSCFSSSSARSTPTTLVRSFTSNHHHQSVQPLLSYRTKNESQQSNHRSSSSSRGFHSSALFEARPGQNRSPSGSGKPKKKFQSKKGPITTAEEVQTTTTTTTTTTTSKYINNANANNNDSTSSSSSSSESQQTKAPFQSVYRKIKAVGKGTQRKKIERKVEKITVKAKAAIERRHVRINEGSTVNEIAKAFGIESEQIIKLLDALGDSTSLSVEESVSADSIELVAAELDVDVTIKQVENKVISSKDSSSGGGDNNSLIRRRRPTVCVMGHVDHGKTSLLDALRNASVADGEAGGITQHIGAFVVALPDFQNNNTKNISSKSSSSSTSDGSGYGSLGELTFLDTPGHAAFSAMRQRGASITDIVVLVVAADDGVMPQTKEACAHARVAKVPIVVALTKCDKHNADPDRMEMQVASDLGLELEKFGGSVQVVRVSAHTGEGLKELSEALILESELINLDTNMDKALVHGAALEAKLDKGRGPIVNAILKRGTLEVGDFVLCGSSWGKVRSLRNAKGEELKFVLPGDPFEMMGLKTVPNAGDAIQSVSSEDRARRLSEAREERLERIRLQGTSATGTSSISSILSSSGNSSSSKDGDRGSEENGVLDDGYQELNLIVKADVQGTAEAVRDSVVALGTGKVGVKVVYTGAGQITEGDVQLAGAINAPILGFNVREPNKTLLALAKSRGVQIIRQNVIYRLLDEVGAMLSLRAPMEEYEEIVGEADIVQIFDMSGTKKNNASLVAGCVVSRGSIKLSEKFRILRDGIPIHEEDVLIDCSSIRRHRLEVESVGKGTDCGVSLVDITNFQVGDIIQCITIARRPVKAIKVATGGSKVQ
jgi:translation initiation factor IF-2